MISDKKKKSFEIQPAVCAAGENYVICVPVSITVLMSVFIGGIEFTNDRCGVKISNCYVQKFTVPMELLNTERKYTVVYEVIYREAYCSKKEPPVSREFPFYPIEKETDLRIYHLSDVHGHRSAAVKTGTYFEDGLDLLILNGDISSSTQTVKESLLPLQIAYEITKGEKPCIITRGNHDLRGKYAERIDEFYPLNDGLFYYTVRLGPLWCLVLDCGEDKPDGHREYAGTIAFHRYRETETRFIKQVCADPARFLKNGTKFAMVISHIPFCHTNHPPFDIEIETFSEWVTLINGQIRPDLALFGHIHKTLIRKGPGPYNEKGLSAPVVYGGKPEGGLVVGCALTLRDNTADVFFTNKQHKIIEAESIPLKSDI